MDKEVRQTSDLTLKIIAIALIVIAVSLGYFAMKDLKESRVPFVDPIEVEIKDAKNTTYLDCLVSRMIEHTDEEAKWEYFVAASGHEVVEVTGTIPLANSKDKILSELVRELNLSTDDSKNNAILTDSKFDSTKIKDISFRIQFLKNLDNEPKQGQIYNRYHKSYAEVIITPFTYDVSPITVKASEGIFSFLFSCLNSGLISYTYTGSLFR